MYVLIVSLICALMLGGVYYATYGDIGNTVLVTFLLFVAIDTGLRSVLNKPSWVVQILDKRKG